MIESLNTHQNPEISDGPHGSVGRHRTGAAADGIGNLIGDSLRGGRADKLATYLLPLSDTSLAILR